MSEMTLREQCEALVRQIGDYSFCTPTVIEACMASDIARLEAFAKQQQAVGLREAMTFAEGCADHVLTDSDFDRGQKTGYRTVGAWCEQEAREMMEEMGLGVPE